MKFEINWPSSYRAEDVRKINVDGQTTNNEYWSYWYTISLPMTFQLKKTKYPVRVKGIYMYIIYKYCLFVLMLYVLVNNILAMFRHFWSSWVEPVLSNG